jgi:arylsulfatase A-like enzyme
MLQNRRDFLKAASTGAVAFLAAHHLSAQSQRLPNIVYILADDLGYGDLGCYGQQRVQTPRLDQMAAEGMRFTQHYSGSTVCAPSRCCLMTGMHTGHARVRGNDRNPLQADDVTGAECLKEAGYTTALIGKWGLGDAGSTGTPNRQGFDYFYGYLDQRHAHNYYPSVLWRNDQKETLPNKVDRKPPDGDETVGGVSSNKAVYSHDLFTHEALNFIRKTQEKPFFLYLAYTIPHANNEAGTEGMEVPSLAPYDDEDWPAAQKGKAAMITRLDRDVGRVLDQLRELGLAENTLVIFTSDNGPHKEGGADPDFFDSNGSLRGIKRDMYEGGIRVPHIAWWPGTVQAGAESAHASAFWDFLPTACELAGAQAPDGTDGISYLPAMLAKAQPEHEDLYWEFYEQGGKQALRKGPWKAIRLECHKDPDGPLELYNIDEDPAEATNIADAHPEIVEEMRQRIARAHVPTDTYKFGR